MEREVAKNEHSAQAKDMLAGILSGGVVKGLEYPLDTLKVLMQIEKKKIRSTTQFCKNVIKNEGFFRLYRGLLSPMVGSSVEYLLSFWLFGTAERFMQYHLQKPQLSLFEIGLAGAFSGIGIGLWLTPVEFVKCQLQSSALSSDYRNTFHCISYHLRHNPSNLMTGLKATLYREIPGTFIYFYAYRFTTRNLTNILYNGSCEKRPPLWVIFAGGAMSGVVFWTIMFPIDLVKSNIQSQKFAINHNLKMASIASSNNTTITTTLNHNNSNNSNISIFKAIIQRYKRYGFVSLYNGYSVTMPRAFLFNGMIFTIYEYTRNVLDYVWQ